MSEDLGGIRGTSIKAPSQVETSQTQDRRSSPDLEASQLDLKRTEELQFMVSVGEEILARQEKRSGKLKVGGGQLDRWGQYTQSGEGELSSSGVLHKKRGIANANASSRGTNSSQVRAGNRQSTLAVATGKSAGRPRTSQNNKYSTRKMS